jgi:hypothetical protein
VTFVLQEDHYLTCFDRLLMLQKFFLIASRFSHTFSALCFGLAFSLR